jgi:hypothetical protein
MVETAFIDQLRQELPRLLRERPEVRYELWGMMLEAFPSRQEFMDLLEEVRASREESNRHFEAMRQESNRRFEEAREQSNRHFEEMRQDMNSRFEAVDQRFVEMRQDMNSRFEVVTTTLRRQGDELQRQGRQLRELTLQVSSLGSRVGYGLEHVVREVVEEFAGETFPFVQQHFLVRDAAGEVYGVPGAEVEFDLYAHNGVAYLVEVKSHLKPSDVLAFYRKVKFAEVQLGRTVIPLVIALSMDARAEQQMQTLGVKYHVRAVMTERPSDADF